MLRIRIMPCLLLDDNRLVKTIKFKNPQYIGDPINAVRIFNELEVDELIFLDIEATKNKKTPNYKLIKNIARECFMPFCYGGGIHDTTSITTLFNIGVEKVAINNAAFHHPELISEASRMFGNQSIVVSIDVKKNFFGKYEVYLDNGTKNTKIDPVQYAQNVQHYGAGEILLNAIDKDGTWSGYDLELIKRINKVVSIPVVVSGGAGSVEDIVKTVEETHISALAIGSMVVYQKKGLGVLINFPDRHELEEKINVRYS